jgi:hypothetical protein
LAEPFYDTDDEELIDALYGKGDWFGAGQSGGLYQAIKEDMQKMSTAMQAGQQQVEQRTSQMVAQPQIQIKQEPEYFVKEDGSINPNVHLPSAVPAPEPTTPIGGAARRPSKIEEQPAPIGFGGLPLWK